MKIILADDSEDVRDLFSMNIQSFLTTEIFECSSSKDAIALLEKDTNYNVIVSDLNMPGGNGDEIYQYLKDHELKIPFILITGMDKLDGFPTLANFLNEGHGNSKLDKPPLDDDFKNAFKKAFSHSIQEEIQKEPPEESPVANPVFDEYMPVSIRNFKRINSSSVDIYLKLSDKKLVKIFNQNEMFSSQEVERYEQKKIEYLYVKGTDFSIFTKYMMNIMTKALQLNEKATLEEISTAYRDSFEVIQTNLLDIGISQEFIDITKASVAASIKMIESNCDLARLLKLGQAEGGYTYRHSLMLSFICTAIANKMEWQSKEIQTKLSLAALMHDITLTEEIDSIKLLDQYPELRKKCSPKAQKNYEQHPANAAKLVEQLKDFPHNVATIIIQHHENPEGTGFPRKLDAGHVSPLSCLFIVAHEFVNLMIDTDFSISRRDNAIVAISNTHSKGNYKDAVKGLVQLFST